MSHRSNRLLAVACLVLPAAVAAHAPTAEACLNEVIYQNSPSIQGLTLADQQLGTGKPAQAVSTLLRLFPDLRSKSWPMPSRESGAGRKAVQAARGQRLLAVATARTEGLLEVDPRFPADSAEARRANLEWSIKVLRAFARSKDAPAAQTDLAEALSKLPETRAEASTILEDLAAKDLITSPYGYGSLADLRLARGDRAGAAAARERFEKMARAALGPAVPKGAVFYGTEK